MSGDRALDRVYTALGAFAGPCREVPADIAVTELISRVTAAESHAGRLESIRIAADRVKHRWNRLCDCVNEFEPEDMAACGESRDALDDAILKLIAALAAVRGDGEGRAS